MLENDGPSGLNRHMNAVDGEQNPDRAGWTMFPSPTLLANTWNWSLAYAYGLSVGNEGMATGVSGWYAPGANMQRSPFSGRNCEYYSEDSYLSGVMAAETARGAINNGMNVYVKHFVVKDGGVDNHLAPNQVVYMHVLVRLYLEANDVLLAFGYQLVPRIGIELPLHLRGGLVPSRPQRLGALQELAPPVHVTDDPVKVDIHVPVLDVLPDLAVSCPDVLDVYHIPYLSPNFALFSSSMLLSTAASTAAITAAPRFLSCRFLTPSIVVPAAEVTMVSRSMAFLPLLFWIVAALIIVSRTIERASG